MPVGFSAFLSTLETCCTTDGGMLQHPVLARVLGHVNGTITDCLFQNTRTS